MKRLFSKIIKMFKPKPNLQAIKKDVDKTKNDIKDIKANQADDYARRLNTIQDTLAKVVAQQAVDDARRLKYAREREAERANKLKASED